MYLYYIPVSHSSPVYAYGQAQWKFDGELVSKTQVPFCKHGLLSHGSKVVVVGAVIKNNHSETAFESKGFVWIYSVL